jgi:uncharacterized protein YjbI with pentapeptide repeats
MTDSPMLQTTTFKPVKDQISDSSNTRKSTVETSYNFVSSDLHHRDLRGTDLSGVDLRQANLRGADLRGAILNKADLRGATLSGANLRGATLTRIMLHSATLSGAIFNGADLSGAILNNANLWDANLSGAVLHRANLKDANLSGADLSGADLRGAILQNADLRNANLKRTNLWGTNLTSANLSGATLSRVDLSNANLTAANLWDTDLSDTDLSSSIVENARFGQNIGLSETTKSDLKQQGAVFTTPPKDTKGVQSLRDDAYKIRLQRSLEIRPARLSETTHGDTLPDIAPTLENTTETDIATAVSEFDMPSLDFDTPPLHTDVDTPSLVTEIEEFDTPSIDLNEMKDQQPSSTLLSSTESVNPYISPIARTAAEIRKRRSRLQEKQKIPFVEHRSL